MKISLGDFMYYIYIYTRIKKHLRSRKGLLKILVLFSHPCFLSFLFFFQGIQSAHLFSSSFFFVFTPTYIYTTRSGFPFHSPQPSPPLLPPLSAHAFFSPSDTPSHPSDNHHHHCCKARRKGPGIFFYSLFIRVPA